MKTASTKILSKSRIKLRDRSSAPVAGGAVNLSPAPNVHGESMATQVKYGLELVLILAACMLYVTDAHAAISSKGLMDQVLLKYSTVASTWKTVITAHASWLFWVLALISMTWTFGMMALRQADASEFFAEFIKFTVFTGFYWWLLSNGPEIALAIMNSMKDIAGQATGTGSGLSPSGIIDVGFQLFDSLSLISFAIDPADTIICFLLAVAILVILALVSVNMLLLLISSWVLAYAGIFFLGFGGSRWTSEMALTYFRTVLSVGAQLFAMVLLVGIGKSFLLEYFTKVDDHGVNELTIILVVSVILLVLVNKVPALIGGLAMGGGTGALGAGLGAGAVVAGAAMAAAAASTMAKSLTSAATNIAGGAQAVMEAMSQANKSDGGDGGGSKDFLSTKSGDNAKSGNGGESAFAQAMGNDNSSSSGSSSGSSTSSSSPGSEQRSSSGSAGGEKKGAGSTAGSNSGGTSAGAKAGSKQSAARAGGCGGGAKTARAAAGALASGIAQVAKASFNARVANTIGGKVAQAIRDSNGADKTSDASNSLSAGSTATFDPDSEVAAFRDRDKPDDEDPDPGPSKA